MNNFTKQILADIKVKLADEFDKNFERKAFFNKKWPAERYPNSKGSLMQRSGRLRNSVKAKISGTEVVFSSNMSYANIHNSGGTITVTAKMKRFFWAMYYKCSGAANVYNVKSKKKVNTQRTRKLSEEAEKWKALALLPVGHKMKIEQRQFIGHHHTVDTLVEQIADRNFKELANQLIKR